MQTNFRKSYHETSKRAHQHMLIVGLGLFICASMALTQLFNAPENVAASRTPTRCADNSGSLQIPLEECNVLADLYTATNGDNRYNNNNRFQGDGSDMCEQNGNPGRNGMACLYDQQTHTYFIRNLWLQNNNLIGTLPDNLYTLSHLEKLAVNGNKLDIDINKITQSTYASNYIKIDIKNNIIHGDITNFNNLSNIEDLNISCDSQYAKENPNNCLATGDISFVPLTTKLRTINVSGQTGVTFDLSYLENAPQITDIGALNSYVVGDVSSLAGLTGLRNIDISCWDILDGECDVTGNINFLQNMHDIEYVSLDSLKNLEGTLDVFYDKTKLKQIDVSHNKISGTIGMEIGNLTLLNALDLDENQLEGILPEEMYNLTLLERLRIDDNFLSGALLAFYNFPVLEELDIGSTDMNYNNIREMITPPEGISLLKELGINNANIGGALPDIWNMFPYLEELNLQFNGLTGPFPATFASLTNLDELLLRFNNLDGDIPTYLINFNLEGGDLALESNCLNGDVTDQNLFTFLMENSPGWENQYNCKANIDVSSQTASGGLEPGQCGMYTINYINHGPQQAINMKIGQSFGANIVASGSTPEFATGLVGREYGTLNDPCYIQAMQSASGPYFDAYENLLINSQEYPFNSIYDFALFIGEALEQEAFTGAQGTTEFAYVLDNFCPFVFGTNNHYLCLLLAGMDLKEIEDPSCGYGGTGGYIRDLGTVPAYDSGSIEVELCNQSSIIKILDCTDINIDTISENENQGICEVTVGECGDGEEDEGEQCDDGNTEDGDGCSALCTIETESNPTTCGDNITQGAEQCDDGNTQDDDGCNSSCNIENPSCTITANQEYDVGEPTTFVLETFGATDTTYLDFGNDDGIARGIQTSMEYTYPAAGVYTATLEVYNQEYPIYTGSCSFLVTINPVCGDAVTEGTEQCDDGEKNGQIGYCNDTCTAQIPTPTPDPEPTPIRGGGGGGSFILQTDEQEGICQIGEDKSPSSYDRICTGEEHESATKKMRLIDDPKAFKQEVQRVSNTASCKLSEEVISAYVFGFDLGLTTVKDPCKADLMEAFDRERLSKMMTMFAVNAFERKPEKRSCNFNDIHDRSNEMKKFITLSCELKIMGENRAGQVEKTFNPTGEVTREIFAVGLSRLLWNGANNTNLNDERHWASLHLKGLQKAGIMQNTQTAKDPEIKGYALIMFMRTYLLMQQENE